MKPAAQAYNLRVYGIVFRGEDVLLSEEFRMGMRMTKFPGGGVEPGEGIRDALYREFREEMGTAPQSATHFYTTDFYLESAFHPGVQLISIYYLVRCEGLQHLPFLGDTHHFSYVEGFQGFRWASLRELQPADVTFPVDQLVLEKLRSNSPGN